MRHLTHFVLLLAAAAVVTAAVASRFSPATESGTVRWHRDLDAARAQAASTGRPMMLLNWDMNADGRDGSWRGPLSHPIVVDAANHEFVPVRVAGSSSSAHVPAPPGSIRFLAADGRDLNPARATAPVDEAPSTARLLTMMDRALVAAGRPVPEYLRLVAGEYDPPARETATFAVTCYWKGEKELGALDGVVATRTGMLDGEEVVEVDFNPNVLGFRSLATSARAMACYRKVYARSPGQAQAAAGGAGADVASSAEPVYTAGNQQQYHLWLRKAWHLVPLTQLQATKVNAALLRQESPDRYLSPSQIAIQRRLQAMYDRDVWSLDDTEAAVAVNRSPDGLADYSRRIQRALDTIE